MTISAVLFDFDGTLHDRASSIRSFLYWHSRFLSSRYSISIDPRRFIQRFLELDMNGYRSKEEVYPILISEFHLPISLSEMLLHYRLLSLSHTKEMKGAGDLLRTLVGEGVKVAIVTNGFVDFQLNRICYLGLEKFAHEIVVSEEEQVRKPEPEIYLRAAARLAVDTLECVFIGDHPVNDVLAPRALGMRAVWFDNGDVEWGESDPCPDRITHLYQLLPLLGLPVAPSSDRSKRLELFSCLLPALERDPS